jgi:hypothetical protein
MTAPASWLYPDDEPPSWDDDLDDDEWPEGDEYGQLTLFEVDAGESKEL